LAPPGTAIGLNTSTLSLEADGDCLAFHDDGDFAFSCRVFEHDFELFRITDDVQVLYFLACL
jgi:hypothetical protein